MSCNCKNDKKIDTILEETGNATNKKFSFGKYSLKTIAFLVFLVLSPIMLILLIWFGFKILVLNDSIDIKPLLNFLTTKIKDKTSDDDEFEELDENDFVIVGVDDITNKN